MDKLQILQSRIPCIIAKQGYAIQRLPQQRVVYDGRHISTLLHANQGDYTDQGVKEFLVSNKIGSPFDIKTGINVKIISKTEKFSKYQE